MAKTRSSEFQTLEAVQKAGGFQQQDLDRAAMGNLNHPNFNPAARKRLLNQQGILDVPTRSIFPQVGPQATFAESTTPPGTDSSKVLVEALFLHGPLKMLEMGYSESDIEAAFTQAEQRALSSPQGMGEQSDRWVPFPAQEEAGVLDPLRALGNWPSSQAYEIKDAISSLPELPGLISSLAKDPKGTGGALVDGVKEELSGLDVRKSMVNNPAAWTDLAAGVPGVAKAGVKTAGKAAAKAGEKYSKVGGGALPFLFNITTGDPEPIFQTRMARALEGKTGSREARRLGEEGRKAAGTVPGKHGFKPGRFGGKWRGKDRDWVDTYFGKRGEEITPRTFVQGVENIIRDVKDSRELPIHKAIEGVSDIEVPREVGLQALQRQANEVLGEYKIQMRYVKGNPKKPVELTITGDASDTDVLFSTVRELENAFNDSYRFATDHPTKGAVYFNTKPMSLKDLVKTNDRFREAVGRISNPSAKVIGGDISDMIVENFEQVHPSLKSYSETYQTSIEGVRNMDRAISLFQFKEFEDIGELNRAIDALDNALTEDSNLARILLEDIERTTDIPMQALVNGFVTSDRNRPRGLVARQELIQSLRRLAVIGGGTGAGATLAGGLPGALLFLPASIYITSPKRAAKLAGAFGASAQVVRRTSAILEQVSKYPGVHRLAQGGVPLITLLARVEEEIIKERKEEANGPHK